VWVCIDLGNRLPRLFLGKKAKLVETSRLRCRLLFRGSCRRFAPIQAPTFVFLCQLLANPNVISPPHPLRKVRIQSLKAGALCYI
jgi:hypothetical protein